MEVEEGKVELLATEQFFFERFLAFMQDVRIRGAKIDQVAVMAHNFLHACILHGLFKKKSPFLANGFPFPPFLVACKKLNCCGPNFSAFQNGVVNSSLRRGVGTDQQFFSHESSKLLMSMRYINILSK